MSSLASRFPSLLYLCKNPKQLLQVHARLLIVGVHENATLASQLIETYTHFGRLRSSRQVLYSFPKSTTFLYNILLRTFIEVNNFTGILSAYQEMTLESVSPDEETFYFVLVACSRLRDYSTEKKILARMIKSQPIIDSFLSAEENYRKCVVSLKQGVNVGSLRATHSVVLVNGLFDFVSEILQAYCKVATLEDARKVFDQMPIKDTFSYNTMISTYTHQGHFEEPAILLRNMAYLQGALDVFTIIHAFSLVIKRKSLNWGKETHSYALKNSLFSQVSVHNAAIDMYCECGCLEYAEKAFATIPIKNLITYSTMIKGYVNTNHPNEALSLFKDLKLQSLNPDSALILNMLPACVGLGSPDIVRYFHGYVQKQGLNTHVPISTSLQTTYEKCGDLETARKVFDESPSRDIISWNSMISAYGKHGDWRRCLELYEQLKTTNTAPDTVTYLGVLSACVNSGLVEKGKEVFEEIRVPTKEHFGCVVDLLARAGRVKEALKLVATMPFRAEGKVWSAVLSGAKTHRVEGVGDVAGKLTWREGEDAGIYVLLSNIYAAEGKWEMVAKTRRFLKEKKIKKEAGKSSIEINGKLYEFVSGGCGFRSDEVYRVLKWIEMRSKKDELFVFCL